MTFILAVMGRKGGIGKSTMAINLAAAAALAGWKTLIIQSDGQKDTSSGVGLEPREDFYQLIAGDAEYADLIRPVPAAFAGKKDVPLFLLSSGAAQRAVEVDIATPLRMVERLKELQGYFDLVIGDTSPGVTEIHTGWLLSADSVLLPTNCETFAVKNSLPEMLDYVANAHDARLDLGKSALQVLGILPNRYVSGIRESQRLIGYLFGSYEKCYHVFEPLRELTVWGTAAAQAKSIYAVSAGLDRRLGINKRSAIKEFGRVTQSLFDAVAEKEAHRV